MAQTNPFADLIPAQPQAGPPARIYGAPERISPAEQVRLDIAQQGNARAERSDARAAEAAARADRTEQRRLELDARKLNQETKLTEGEAKSTQFYNSAIGAERDWNALVNDPTTREGTSPNGVLGDAARQVLPAGIVNSWTSSARQRANQAKEDFIRASLRQESGAAIGRDEFERQDRIFYPQAGDSEETIAQKARARQRVIEGFRITAGTGASKVDALRGEVQFNDQQGPRSSQSYRLTPDQEAQLSQVVRSGATADQIIAKAQEFGGNIERADAERLAKLYADPKNRNIPTATDYSKADAIQPVQVSGEGATAAALRGAADTITLGALPRLGAIADTVTRGGTYAENLDRNRGILLGDEQRNPGARIAGQVAGGFALPSFGASSIGQLAALGAGYAGAYGVLSSGEDLTSGSGIANAVGSAIPQAVAGGAVGAGLGAGGRYLASRFGGGAPPRGGGGSSIQSLTDAAARVGVEPTVADVVPGARSLTGFLESLPIAGGAVRRGLQRGADQIEQGVQNVGGDAAMAADRPTIGETIRGAGERYVDRSRSVVNNLYRRAETLANGQQVTPRAAVNNLDQQLAELARTPEANASKINILQRLRSDMVAEDGSARALDIDSIRALRTSMRDELNANGLRASDAERRVMQVIDAANTDITSQLTGPALRAYQRADRTYRQRADMVDNVVKRFIGGRNDAALSAENVVSRVENAARPRSGDAQALSRMMGTLEPAERQQVASTIASQLGRRGTDGDNAFSPAAFFSQVQAFSPEARNAIWGAQGARDLADLARIAEARGAVMGRLNNSRSGQVSNWFMALRDVLGGAGAGAGLGLATGLGAGTGAGAAGSLLAGGYATARILGSRRVVSALASASRANTPQARQQVLTRLGDIAAREPQLANDLLPVQRALQSSVTKAAAQENNTPQNGYEPQGPKPVVPGNIDIHNRPVVKNSDGTISTVRSMSFGTDQGEVLIPTVSPDGRILTDDQAIRLYEQTGQHLGIFRTPEQATAYAESLHNEQAQEYGR